jgi:hypothetical protein
MAARPAYRDHGFAGAAGRPGKSRSTCSSSLRVTGPGSKQVSPICKGWAFSTPAADALSAQRGRSAVALPTAPRASPGTGRGLTSRSATQIGAPALVRAQPLPAVASAVPGCRQSRGGGQDHLGPAVIARVEVLVAVGGLVQRQLVRDDERGLGLAGVDQLIARNDPRALPHRQRHRARRLLLKPLAAGAPAALPAAGRDPAGGEPVPGNILDCRGLRTLLVTCRKAEEWACSIRFSELSSPVQRVAKLTGQREAIPMAGPPASQGGHRGTYPWLSAPWRCRPRRASRPGERHAGERGHAPLGRAGQSGF